MKRTWGFACLVILLACPVVFAEAREEFSKTYPLSENGVLNLTNLNGDVTITGWNRKEVEIRTIKTADSEKHLKDFWIEIGVTGNRIDVETKYSEKRQFRPNPGSVTFEVHVPKGLDLKKVSLVNGDLSISATEGRVTASSVNGEVTAIGIRAPSRLSTVNGALEVTFDQLNEGEVQISSVSGTILVAVPKNSDAAFMASTLSGSIRNDFGFEEDGERFIGRKLRGTLGRGTARVELSNVSGPIVIVAEKL